MWLVLINNCISGKLPIASRFANLFASVWGKVFHDAFNWLGYTILTERGKAYHKGHDLTKRMLNGPVLIMFELHLKPLRWKQSSGT